MAKPFPPTVGPDQPHLRKLEEMGAEKYFLEKGKKDRKKYKFDIGSAKRGLEESGIEDFERKHGGMVLHTEMYGGTTYYKDGTVISVGKGEGHVSDSGIVWDRDVEEWLKESKISKKYRLKRY